MNIREQKKALRKEIHSLIADLDRSYTEQADQSIVRHLLSLPAYAAADTVFCFVGTELEINTIPFLEQVLSAGKTLAVPLCTGKGIMQARQIFSLSELEKGYRGLWEPAASAPLIPPQQIGLAVIPCVSCTRTGVRLGHGGGFYDIYFSRNAGIPAVMICRELVMCEDIPREDHDLLFPRIISEKGLYC